MKEIIQKEFDCYFISSSIRNNQTLLSEWIDELDNSDSEPVTAFIAKSILEKVQSVYGQYKYFYDNENSVKELEANLFRSYEETILHIVELLPSYQKIELENIKKEIDNKVKLYIENCSNSLISEKGIGELRRNMYMGKYSFVNILADQIVNNEDLQVARLAKKIRNEILSNY
jgi:K+/H+ antiporter YhaU regulatory subunit KhtT